jgi:hypothetical protein
MKPTTESQTIKWPICSVMFQQMAEYFQGNYFNVMEKMNMMDKYKGEKTLDKRYKRHSGKKEMTAVLQTKLKLKQNSVALVRERTIPTERPPLVGEVSANLCR